MFKGIILSIIAIGMVVASAVQPDTFLSQVELLFGAGAFALAWVLPTS